MDENLNKQFEALMSQLEGDIKDPARSLSMSELNETVLRLSEASMFIAEFMAQAYEAPTGVPIHIPQAVVVVLPQVRDLCETIVDELHDVTCGCDDDDEDEE